MNNWNNQYGYSNWDRPITNAQYCTGIEEALSRCNRPNTENIFFHQDQPIFYRIKVEMDGKKMWQGFKYDVLQPDSSDQPLTRSDLTDIVERIKRIEDYVFQDPSEVHNE